MANIHPTAIVDERAQLWTTSAWVRAALSRPTSRSARARSCESVVIRRYTTLGSHNLVDAFCVLGGEPQDLKFDPNTVSYLRIGEGNVFREHVTISRATGEGNVTLVGNKTYWMAGAHAGRNATVEDEAILVNGSALAGHSTLGAKAILSAHVVVHQFTWVGTMVMSQGNCAVSMHVPPYVLIAGVSRVIGLNSIGLRHHPHIAQEDRRQIKEAFVLTYRSGLTPAKALEKMDACADWGKPADAFRQFIRRVVTARNLSIVGWRPSEAGASTARTPPLDEQEHEHHCPPSGPGRRREPRVRRNTRHRHPHAPVPSGPWRSAALGG